MSVVPADFQADAAARPATDPLRAALDRRRVPVDPALGAALDRARRQRQVEAAKAQEIQDWRARFPDLSAGFTDNTVAASVEFEKQHPRLASAVEFLHDRPTAHEAFARSATEFASGLQGSFWEAASNVSQAYATFADLHGRSDLRDEFQQASRKMLEYHESTSLGQFKRGPGTVVGELAGTVAPSALSLVTSGGSSAPVLTYYAFQAFGGGAKEYDETLAARGALPDAVDRFAIASGYAVVEIAAEKIGLDAMGTRVGPKLARSMGDAFLKRRPGEVANILFKANMITDIEGTEELLTQFMQNAIAQQGIPFHVKGFDPDRNLNDGLVRQFLMGKAAGGFLAGPAALGARSISTPSARLVELGNAISNPDAAVRAEAVVLMEYANQFEGDTAEAVFAGALDDRSHGDEFVTSAAVVLRDEYPDLHEALLEGPPEMMARVLARLKQAELAAAGEAGGKPLPQGQPLDVPTAAQVEQVAETQTPRRRPAAVGPVTPPPVIATETPVEAAPDVVDTVVSLDAQGLTTLEEAALDVLFDDTAAVEAQQKAASILEQIDQQARPALGEGQEVREPTRQEKTQFLQDLGIDTKRTGEKTITERQALKASLAAQRRVAVIVAAKVKQEVQAADKAKADINQRTRTQVRRIVRATVARERQGRLLRLVENATPKRLGRVLDEVELAVEMDTVTELARDVKALTKRMKKQRHIAEAERTEALVNLDQAARLLQADNFSSIKGIPAKLGAMRVAVEQAQITGDDVALEIATALGQRRSLLRGRLANTLAAVKQTIANIKADEGGPLAEDVKTPHRKKLGIQLSDVRNLTRRVEGKKVSAESVLHELMWREMTRAHDSYLLQIASRMRQLEGAAQRAGFKSLSDAQAQLSGHGGKALTQTVEVEIGGKPVTITMGQAMWFVANQQDTQALLEAGTPVVVREGVKQKGVSLTTEEIAAIKAKVPRKLRDFVTEAKEITEQDAPELFAVWLELNGKEPRREPNYFRRRRNIKQAEKTGLPRSFRDVLVTYNENLNFGKERTGGTTTPIIIEDFLTAIMGTVNDTAKVMHVAKPVRDAAGVLLNPDVQTAINRKHGQSMNDALELHLGAASLAGTRQDSMAKIVRALNANLASSKLGLNPSSMLRQLGGLPRMAPILGARRMADGIAGYADVSMQEMTEVSGFFWERYVSNISSRFSPVEADQTFGTSQGTMAAAMDRATKSIFAGDVVAAYQGLRDAGMSTLEFLNFFDSINAKLAYAGYKAESKREHPDRTEQQHRKWAGEKAADIIRETQNSSSVLDLSTVALRTRGNLASIWLLFSSDRFKTANRVRRAFAAGPADGAQVVAAESMNMVWSVLVGRGTTLTVQLLVAAMLGDDEDREAAVARALEVDKAVLQLALEAVNTFDPLITPRLIELAGYQQANIFDSAAGSSIGDLAKGAIQMVDSAKTLAEGDQEKAGEDFVKGLRKVGLEATALSGLNPMDANMRRVFSAIDKLEDDDQAKALGR